MTTLTLLEDAKASEKAQFDKRGVASRHVRGRSLNLNQGNSWSHVVSIMGTVYCEFMGNSSIVTMVN